MDLIWLGFTIIGGVEATWPLWLCLLNDIENSCFYRYKVITIVLSESEKVIIFLRACKLHFNEKFNMYMSNPGMEYVSTLCAVFALFRASFFCETSLHFDQLSSRVMLEICKKSNFVFLPLFSIPLYWSLMNVSLG